jgi:GT2 family glycosyltransferase
MSHRLDIGISSFNAPDLLRRTIDSVISHSTTDWRLIVVDNRSDRSEEIYALVNEIASKDGRVRLVAHETNTGYAGAVETIQKLCSTEYCLYMDGDTEVQTHGWDELMASYLDRFHEIGILFPNGGAYEIDRGSYHELLWGVGFCWMLNRLCMTDVGYMDTTIGHQNECDLCLRTRMAGWKCAAAKDVHVSHLARATNEQSAASIERINRGVVQFVDKWTRYFGGKNIDYHSPNVIRWHDWPPNAIYLEEFFKLNGLAHINRNPETVAINGEEFDLVRVPRLKGFYRDRVI